MLSVIAGLLFLLVVALPPHGTHSSVARREPTAPDSVSEYAPDGETIGAPDALVPDPRGGTVDPAPAPSARIPGPSLAPPPADQPSRPHTSPTVVPDRTQGAAAPVRPEHRGTLYLVIDDAGYSMSDLERFLAFPNPITIAVLPHLRWSTAAALRTTRAGKEVILHLPMEAMSGADPGPGAILVSHDEAQIRRRVHEALASVPGATGANNHMGSRATSDRRVMDIVITELNARGLFFLDSRTSAETVARPAAMDAGIRFTERHVFLDNERNEDAIRSAIAEGLRVAEQRGYAVMIGHVTVPELARVLVEVHPSVIAQGFTFGVLSDLMSQSIAYERTGN